jgi:Ni/Fe-hydrogenase subunit HybB-like protein
MNIYIVLFLTFGAFFGLGSFSHRHLFSEGPHQPASGTARNNKRALAFWTLVCIFLWPIMVISGLNTAWVLARRKARADAPRP